MILRPEHAITFTVSLIHGAMATLDALGEERPAALLSEALDELEATHPDPVARLRAARFPSMVAR